MPLIPVAENLWVLHYPLSVLGTHHGRTVTVIRLKSGKLVLHSMAPFTAEDVDAIRGLGSPGWLLEAMLLHDTYAQEGRAAFPAVPFLAPPGFSSVVNFPTLPLVPPPPEWAEEIVVIPLQGVPKLDEHVILHRPSRTLIVADLIFNFREDERGWDRFFHRWIAGFSRYPGMSRIFRLFISNRALFRASLATVMELDFDRIIPGHGEIIDGQGKSLLQRGLKDAGILCPSSGV